MAKKLFALLKLGSTILRGLRPPGAI